MTPKLVFLIIVAFSAVQVSAEDELPQLMPLDVVIDVMGQTIGYVHKIIDLLFDGTEDTLKGLLAKIDNLRAGALDLVEKQIEIETVLIQKLIGTIKNRTNGEENMGLLSCIEEIEVDVENVERQTVNTSVACIDKSLEATGGNIISILKDFRQMNDDFVKHEEKLAECRGQLLPFNCIKQVVVDLGTFAFDIPNKLKIELDKAIYDFVILGVDVFQCTEQATNIINDKGMELINAFSQCVKNT